MVRPGARVEPLYGRVLACVAHGAGTPQRCIGAGTPADEKYTEAPSVHIDPW